MRKRLDRIGRRQIEVTQFQPEDLVATVSGLRGRVVKVGLERVLVDIDHWLLGDIDWYHPSALRLLGRKDRKQA